jgi:multisubunit Na+/H+ antiporter MnhE subunit
VFPVGLLLLLRYGRISLDLPLSAFRLDLWLLFFACVAFRVALAVVKTGYAAISGRASPAIVALPIPLRSEMGQLLLLWAITVTPGTIALLVEKDTVYIHCLHRPSDPQSLGLTRLVTLLERIWG